VKFHQHFSNNMLLGKPPGSKDVETMPATMWIAEDGSVTVASFWRPEPEELAALNAGGSVVLYVAGTVHPPVAIGVEIAR
jgi:hypothetical protein